MVCVDRRGGELWAPAHPSLLLVYKIFAISKQNAFHLAAIQKVVLFVFKSPVVATEDRKEDGRE